MDAELRCAWIFFVLLCKTNTLGETTGAAESLANHPAPIARHFLSCGLNSIDPLVVPTPDHPSPVPHMNGDRPRSGRIILPLLVVGAVILGGLAVKRAVNGNADISGNYRHWRVNLTTATLPVRREGPDPQDPDSYPPLTYAIYAPLGALPLWATATLWYGLNLGCSVYLWRSARYWLRSQRWMPEDVVMIGGRTILFGPDRILGLAVVAILPSWIGSLLLGQNTLLVMTLTWGAFQSVRRNYPWLAGGLLAFATTIKVLPAVFLLPFLMRRNYRVLLAFAITGLALLVGLGNLYFGPRTNFDFHYRWLHFAVQGPENRPPDPHDPNTLRGSLRYHNQSIETVLARVLMDVPIHNKAGALRVNLVNVSAGTWRRVCSVATGFCLILGLLSLYRSSQPNQTSTDKPAGPTVDEDASETSVETYAIVSMLQLFVSPVVWSHYYLWLFWPLLVVLVSAVRGRRSGFVIYLVWIAAMPLIAIPEVRAVGLHLWVTLAIYVWICWPLLTLQRRGDRVEVPG